MKPLLLIVACCLVCGSFAQSNDFFLLRKRNGKTVNSFYKGSFISLLTKEKESHSGYIKKIARDSVWVEYQQVLRGMTMIGSVISDTVTYEAKRYAVKDIAFIGKEKGGFQQAVPSALLKIGGAGYILLHVVNGLIQKEKINMQNVSIAAAAYLAGVLMNKLRKNYYSVGRRFRIQYISLSNSTNNGEKKETRSF